jgi:thiol-disulfide isomerase/thioredoxin
LVQEPVRCPQISSDHWIGGGPAPIGHGTVVLIDFWDYTCVNCIATLPYLKAWHERYRGPEFEIVGVHAPEFPFARDPGYVERAVRDLGITWPVAIDNDYRIWQAYANRYWPAKYLADARGYLRYYHFGEGGYDETEAAIQALIREVRPDATLPPLLEPLRGRDMPGAVCYRPTPELYLGHARGLFGQQQEIAEDEPKVYHVPERRAMNAAYLDGPWTVQRDAAEAGAGASLSVWYQAAEVNLVLHPGTAADGAIVAIDLDGGPVPPHLRGEDVVARGDDTAVVIDGPRMYRLIAGESFEEHELRLRALTPGIRAYAFTFVSCVKAS